MSTERRRDFLRTSTMAGAGLLLAGCGKAEKSTDNSDDKKEETKKGGEVTATEDLMREHGVLRRALLVYSAAASQLRSTPGAVPPDALQKTAKLFRAFGEDYHEKNLEEAYIFPAVRKAGGTAAALPDILLAQHQRGREITDYIIAAANSKFGTANAASVAQALESFVLMYRHHAAREDTIIFPAWKQTLTGKQLDEMNEKFEDIEHQQFGKDGFEDAVAQVADIEGSLGIADLAKFTAPPPPST